MTDDSGKVGGKKKAARRKAPKKRFMGLAFVVRDGQGYLIAQGIEQADEFERKKKTRFIEVGVRRTVAFKVDPGEAIHIACDLLRKAGFHLNNCGHCHELVVETALAVGALEEVDERP